MKSALASGQDDGCAFAVPSRDTAPESTKNHNSCTRMAFGAQEQFAIWLMLEALLLVNF
jgi:hypothetical protein